MNNWKKIWDKKTAKDSIILNGNREAVLLELKRCNGFDIVDGMSYGAFFAQYEEIRDNLQKYREIKSVYEVARNVLKTEDILCAEAVDVTTDKMYDAVFSNSVFSYFDNEEYAEKVLEKMYRKAGSVIGLIDIHDSGKKEDFVTYRRKVVEDYDRRYADLPKLFYSRQFFERFAQGHNMKINFLKSNVEGYWNNQFVFSCYMYKH